MASPETASGRRPSRAMLFRGIGFAVAVVLGGIAVWLIATGSTVKAQRVGALSGMWGVLVGAYSIFGARRHDEPLLEVGTALELRQSAAIARSEDVAWQREFQARLEALLRREVQEGVSRELAGLRHEVAALRTEILEKVGGQLRMERTETTRLFGSNLEALQREVRLLKVAQLGDTDTIDVTTYEPVTRAPALPPEATRAAEPVREPEPARAAGPSVRPAEPEPATDPESADGRGRPPAELLRPSMPTYPAVPPDAGNMPFPPFRPLQPVRAFSSPSEDEPVEAVPEPALATLPDPLPASAVTPAPYVSEPLPAAPMFSDPIPFPPYALPTATSAPLPAPPPADAPAATTATSAASTIPAYGPPPPAFVPSLPVPHVAPPTEPAAAPSPPAAAVPTAAPGLGSNDPFASMPRIRPFTDFELDAVDRDAQPWQPGAPDPSAARHSSASPQTASGAGGRRRRTDDSDNDILAQILAREKSAHPPQ